MRGVMYFIRILLFTGILGLTGCKESEPITLGLHPWPGYEPLYLASEKGWLPSHVKTMRGDNAGHAIAGLQDGSYDLACLTLDEALRVRDEGTEVTVIASLDQSVGADIVVTASEIESLEQLKGATIAVEQTAVGQLVLVKLLQAAGLSEDEVNVIDTPVDQHEALWAEGKIQAAVTYEPFASRLVGQGAEKRYDSSDFPETIFDVLVVRTDRLKDIPKEDLIAIVDGHYQGVQFIRYQPQEAIAELAELHGISPQEEAQSFTGLILSAKSLNTLWLEENKTLMKSAKKLNALMIEKGMLSPSSSVENLVSSEFIRAK